MRRSKQDCARPPFCSLSRPEEALRHARNAMGGLSGCSIEPWARYAEGLMEGGESGRGKREKVRAELVEQGFQNPGRALNAMFPRRELFDDAG